MADNRNCCQSLGGSNNCKETVCIDCNRVLDSCRDKDCFEDVKVFLTRFGREVIDRATNVRIKNAKIICTNIAIEPLQFNRGFYQVNVRFFVKLIVEACVGMGKSQEFEALCVVEKSVVLYGSEGSVSIYRSSATSNNICSFAECGGDCTSLYSNNQPVAVVEVIDPVVLGCKISEDRGKLCCCCCCEDEVPSNICECVGGELCPGGDKFLYVSLGFFSVVRIERPAQYLINATEYCVPDKECIVTDNDDPCALFAKMSFPSKEFCPPSFKALNACECEKLSKKCC